MGCLFVMFAGLFPRLGLFMLWLARPKMVDAAFDTFIWPLLGIIFLPFTTLMYVILHHGGLSGFLVRIGLQYLRRRPHVTSYRSVGRAGIQRAHLHAGGSCASTVYRPIMPNALGGRRQPHAPVDRSSAVLVRLTQRSRPCPSRE